MFVCRKCVDYAAGIFSYLVDLWYGNTSIERVCVISKTNPRSRMFRAIDRCLGEPLHFDEHEQNPVAVALRTVVDRFGVDQTSDRFGAFRRQFAGYVEMRMSIMAMGTALQRRARAKFDLEEKNHSALLSQLWTQCMGEDVKTPPNPSDHWIEIGFQSESPHTDFRGMGMLALDHLLYMSRAYPGLTRRVLTNAAQYGFRWFDFALTGVNISADVLKFCNDPSFLTFFYQFGASNGVANTLYVLMYWTLMRVWERERPENVMAFQIIHARAVQELTNSIHDPNTLMNDLVRAEQKHAKELADVDVSQVTKQLLEALRARDKRISTKSEHKSSTSSDEQKVKDD